MSRKRFHDKESYNYEHHSSALSNKNFQIPYTRMWYTYNFLIKNKSWPYNDLRAIIMKLTSSIHTNKIIYIRQCRLVLLVSVKTLDYLYYPLTIIICYDSKKSKSLYDNPQHLDLFWRKTYIITHYILYNFVVLFDLYYIVSNLN